MTEQQIEAAARVRAEANAGEPVAWRYKLFEGDPKWTVTTEKPQGVVVEPLFTRPSEQAVTEAMVEAVRKLILDDVDVWLSDDTIRGALKAAMEAGRHQVTLERAAEVAANLGSEIPAAIRSLTPGSKDKEGRRE